GEAWATSACFEHEEDEAQERCAVGERGPEQLARRVWREWRLADDRDAEACRGERVRHRAHRPMPVSQHCALAVEGVLLRIPGDGEVVGVRVEQLVDDG